MRYIEGLKLTVSKINEMLNDEEKVFTFHKCSISPRKNKIITGNEDIFIHFIDCEFDLSHVEELQINDVKTRFDKLCIVHDNIVKISSNRQVDARGFSFKHYKNKQVTLEEFHSHNIEYTSDENIDINVKYIFGSDRLSAKILKESVKKLDPAFPVWHISTKREKNPYGTLFKTHRKDNDKGFYDHPLFDFETIDYDTTVKINIEEIYGSYINLSDILPILRILDKNKKIDVWVNTNDDSYLRIDIPEYSKLYPNLSYVDSVDYGDNRYKKILNNIIKETSMEYIENIFKEIKEKGE